MDEKTNQQEELLHGRRVMEVMLQVIGSKWAMNIVGSLAAGPKRFSDLQKIYYISPRALSNALQLLERYGIISRAVHPTVPVTVEYKLTAAGCDFLEMILAPLTDWWNIWGREELLEQEDIYRYKVRMEIYDSIVTEK